MEMTPLSVISLAPENMAQVDQFASYILGELEGGRLEILDTYTSCIAMEKAMAAVKAILQKEATNEALKHGKEFQRHSFKIKVGEVGSKYHFDQVNDPVLLRKEAEFDKVKSQVDERKNFLKAIKTAMPLIDEETGEVYTLMPVPKTSTTAVIVTMK